MTTETALPPLAVKPQPKAHPARRRKRRLTSLAKHAGLTALSLLMVYPLIWLVVSSFKPNDQIFRNLSIFTTDLSMCGRTQRFASAISGRSQLSLRGLHV